MPVPAFFVLTLLGVFCLWFTRKQKTGRVFLTISNVLLGFLSYGAVSDIIAKPLEREYPPITHFEVLKDIKWIVVLSGGASVDPELPLSTYLSGACLRRLSEGIYIHNRLPETKLLLTGRSAFKGVIPQAQVMGKGRRSVVGGQGSGKTGAAIHEYLGMRCRAGGYCS